MTPESEPMTISKSGGIVLHFSMLFTGISGICYEYNFSKLASDILGNYAKQWAIIIGLMMFFMGVGADIQKHFRDKWMVSQFLGLEILLGLIGGAGPTLILFSFGWAHDHFILIHYFLISLVGLLIGLEIPLLTRINELYVTSLKHNIGGMLRMDYAGSFIGALIWIFVFPRYFNLLESGFLLGLLNIFVAIFTWFWFKQMTLYNRLFIFSAFSVIVILAVGLFWGKEITLSAEQKLYADRIVFNKTTQYQHLIITERLNGDFNLYINGHLQFSSVDEHIYHEFLVHPIMAAAPNRKNILVLGGGDGLAVREILKYPNVETITLVDIDPEMTNIAREEPMLTRQNQGSLSNAKVRVIDPAGLTPGKKIDLDIHGKGFFRERKTSSDVRIHILNLDALEFLKSVSGIFDLIIIDFPDPNSMALSKLYSVEFYANLKKILSLDGLIIQQSSSPVFAKEAFLMIGRSMEAIGWTALPIHHPVPSFGEWGWWIAGKSDYYDQTTLKKKLTQNLDLPKTTKYITAKLIANSFDFGKDVLQTEKTDVNRMLNDKVFNYYRKAWERAQ